MVKNIGASANAVFAQVKEEGEKKEAKEGKVEEEECSWRENETTFFLKEDPECQISAIEGWCENTKGEVVGSADVCFRHIITGRRVDTVWGAVDGYAGFDTTWADGFETIATRIEEIPQLEKIIRTERSVEL